MKTDMQNSECISVERYRRCVELRYVNLTLMKLGQNDCNHLVRLWILWFKVKHLQCWSASAADSFSFFSCESVTFCVLISLPEELDFDAFKNVCSNEKFTSTLIAVWRDIKRLLTSVRQVLKPTFSLEITRKRQSQLSLPLGLPCLLFADSFCCSS